MKGNFLTNSIPVSNASERQVGNNIHPFTLLANVYTWENQNGNQCDNESRNHISRTIITGYPPSEHTVFKRPISYSSSSRPERRFSQRYNQTRTEINITGYSNIIFPSILMVNESFENSIPEPYLHRYTFEERFTINGRITLSYSGKAQLDLIDNTLLRLRAIEAYENKYLHDRSSFSATLSLLRLQAQITFLNTFSNVKITYQNSEGAIQPISSVDVLKTFKRVDQAHANLASVIRNLRSGLSAS